MHKIILISAMVVDKRNPVLQHLSLEELQLRVSEELSSMKSLKVRLHIPFGIIT